MKKQIQLLFVLIPVLLFTGCPYQAVIPYEEVEKYIEPMIKLTGSYNTEYREIAKLVILESELTLEDGADIYVGATNILEFDTSKVFSYNESTSIELLPGSSARFRLGPLPTVNSESSNITSHINLVSKNINIWDEADFILGSAGSIEIGEGMRIDAGSDFFAYTTMGYEIQLKDIDSTTVWDATNLDTTYYTLLEWTSSIFEEAEIDGEMKIEIVSETENKIVYSKMAMISDKRASISLPSDLMQDYYRIMLRSKNLEHTPSKAVMNGADGIIFGCSDPFLIDTPNKYEYINFTSTKRNYTRKYNSSTKSFEELRLGPKIRNPDKKLVYYTIDGSDPRNSSTSKNSDSYEIEVYIGNADRTEIRAVVKIKEAWGQEIKGTWTITDGEITETDPETDPDPINQVVEPPIFSVKPGTYSNAQIGLSSETDGAKIIYTLNGKDPKNTNDYKTYTKSLYLNSTHKYYKIKARAVKNGVYSDLKEAEYRYGSSNPIPKGVKPIFYVNGVSNFSGTIKENELIQIKCSNTQATIKYRFITVDTQGNFTDYVENTLLTPPIKNFTLEAYSIYSSGLSNDLLSDIQSVDFCYTTPQIPSGLSELYIDIQWDGDPVDHFVPNDETFTEEFVINITGNVQLPNKLEFDILPPRDPGVNGGEFYANEGGNFELFAGNRFIASFLRATNNNGYEIFNCANDLIDNNGNLENGYKLVIDDNGNLSLQNTNLNQKYSKFKIRTDANERIGDDILLRFATELDDSITGICDAEDFFAVYDKILLEEARTYLEYNSLVYTEAQYQNDPADRYRTLNNISQWTSIDNITKTDAVAYSLGAKDTITRFNNELTTQSRCIIRWYNGDFIPGSTLAPGGQWRNYIQWNETITQEDIANGFSPYRPNFDNSGAPDYSKKAAGIDCSGFVQRAANGHKQLPAINVNGFGVALNDNSTFTSARIASDYSEEIPNDLSIIVPGDILFWNNPHGINHIVIVDRITPGIDPENREPFDFTVIEATYARNHRSTTNERTWEVLGDAYMPYRLLENN